MAAVLMISSTSAGIIAVPVSTTPVSVNLSSADALGNMDAQTFLTLTPAKVKEITGKKMKLKERIVLKLTQKHVKKEMKKGKEVDLKTTLKGFSDNFSLGAFLLGVFLLFIGVLIVYLTEWEDRSVARKSAWRGLLTGLLIASAIIGALAGI
jgi:hypothetical protein